MMTITWGCGRGARVGDGVVAAMPQPASVAVVMRPITARGRTAAYSDREDRSSPLAFAEAALIAETATIAPPRHPARSRHHPACGGGNPAGARLSDRREVGMICIRGLVGRFVRPEGHAPRHFQGDVHRTPSGNPGGTSNPGETSSDGEVDDVVI